MAAVTNSNAQKYRYLGQVEATEKPQAETLRDKILKKCLQKQLRTSESLEEYRQNQKDFQHASFEHSLTASGQGLKTLSDFKELQEASDIRQVLTSSGLSEDDIRLLLNEGKGSNLESSEAQVERLQVIREKLENRQQELDASSSEPEKFNGAIALNRHDFEEEMNAIPCSDKADKLTACLIRLEHHSDSNIPTDHPINHIKEIAEELFPSRTDDSESKTHSTKRQLDSSSHQVNKRKLVGEIKHVYLTKKPKTFWDMKEIPKFITNDYRSQENSNTVCNRDGKGVKKDKLFIQKQDKVIKHDPSKPFVLTLEEKELIPLASIESSRKTLEELRKMDKFKNLTLGMPSKTLYLKNLSPTTSPQDLASLFGHFEPEGGPKITYRILNGRMRGQAFVTFQDRDIAEHAMKTCNGYILHDKPIVMEFSKH